MVLGRSVLDHHGVYINDSATQSSVQGVLDDAVEALERLDRDNRLVYNCATFIRRFSQQLSGQGSCAGKLIYLKYLDADATENCPAAAEQYISGNTHKDQPKSETLAYEQLLPSFGLPSLADIDMAQFSSAELLDPSFGKFGMSLDQLHYNY